MKQNKPLIIALSLCLAFGAIMALTIYFTTRSTGTALDSARCALYASVDNPDSIKIIEISKPDSIFGRTYVTEDEKMELSLLMMNANEQLVKQSKDIDIFDFSDPKTNEIMDRLMAASNVVRNLLHTDIIKDSKPKFSGWKVKIKYQGVSQSGLHYTSQYWFITDITGQHVVNSFEIPVFVN